MSKKLLVSIICFASSALFGMRSGEEVFGCKMGCFKYAHVDLLELGKRLSRTKKDVVAIYNKSRIVELTKQGANMCTEDYEICREYFSLKIEDVPYELYDLACELVEQYHDAGNHMGEKKIWNELNKLLKKFIKFTKCKL